MITMAFTQMVFFGFVSVEEYGGDDGLVIDTRSNFGSFIHIENNINLYYFILISLIICLFLIHKITRSRFGLVIEGSRSNEQRMKSIGFDTYRYRLICYVIAGSICGYAGALLGNLALYYPGPSPPSVLLSFFNFSMASSPNICGGNLVLRP